MDNSSTVEVTVTDMGSWVIHIEVKFFNIDLYMHYDYFQSYIDMIKEYYNQISSTDSQAAQLADSV